MRVAEPVNDVTGDADRRQTRQVEWLRGQDSNLEFLGSKPSVLPLDHPAVHPHGMNPTSNSMTQRCALSNFHPHRTMVGRACIPSFG